MSAGIKTDNFATNWLIDRISNSATKNPETGKMEAGFLEGITGSALGLDVDLIGSTKETNINNQAANNLLEANGLTRSELGIGENANITTGLVGSKTRAYKEQKDKDAAAVLRKQNVDDRDAGFDRSDRQLAHTSKMQENRYAFERGEGKMIRRHERELSENSNDLQMQMSLMQNDLAEKRMDYDRETRRLDKRSEMIAQLMSGLGSLGGAFSL